MSSALEPWPWLRAFPMKNGVHLLAPPAPFEEAYHSVRDKEQRIISDAVLRTLPNGRDLWNAAEWAIRKQGAERLLRALSDQGAQLRILEVGCGNGWLSALLQRSGHTVLGMDPFTAELEQAARVFGPRPVFARAPFLDAPVPPASFDVVVFAASIQYFADPVTTVQHARSLLAPQGTVHVLDTILYNTPEEAEAAAARSLSYYTSLGHTSMAAHYHCHQRSALTALPSCSVISEPMAMPRLLRRFRSGSPFTHLRFQR